MTLLRGIRLVSCCLVVLLARPAPAQQAGAFNLAAYIREHYVRSEHRIAMRDGAHLFTVVYAPRDTRRKYPLLLMRTPYSVAPYVKGQFPGVLGPNRLFASEGYIFVYQDVRGRFLSEGEFVNMRPQLGPGASPRDIDESTDTFDTIDWLVKNVPGNNGKVGQWGISYPGFYAAAGMIHAHPALKAVSPQAPIADWFFDDFHHHGTFFLPHAFNFFSLFGQPRPRPTTSRPARFQHGTPDGYQFFLDLGPLKNANPRYLHHKVAFWDEMAEHPNYDAFWQARNLLPHLRGVAPAVLTVGGWFDAEDLYGTLKTYYSIEKQNPAVFNVLVMGPWSHGGWAGLSGDRLGNVFFGSQTAPFFQKEIELPFFNHFLKGQGQHRLPEAYLFETGTNRWRQFDRWPPAGVQAKSLYLHARGRLAFEPPGEGDEAHDEYTSDPARPVPYTERITVGMDPAYMTDDQRYASRRTDVLAYQTEVLTEDVTLAGPMQAELWVATSGTDSDWVVKLIDVFPPGATDYPGMAAGQHLGGYQMLVRSEMIRGRFRKSYAKPEPFVPDAPARVRVELQDVLHTFAKGHRIMIHVSSTWFPLIDRNPQKYVANIFQADEKDFIAARQRVYRGAGRATRVQVGILPAGHGLPPRAVTDKAPGVLSPGRP